MTDINKLQELVEQLKSIDGLLNCKPEEYEFCISNRTIRAGCHLNNFKIDKSKIEKILIEEKTRIQDEIKNFDFSENEVISL